LRTHILFICPPSEVEQSVVRILRGVAEKK
jgi:hypothetical protein